MQEDTGKLWFRKEIKEIRLGEPKMCTEVLYPFAFLGLICLSEINPDVMLIFLVGRLMAEWREKLQNQGVLCQKKYFLLTIAHLRNHQS